MKSKLAPYIVVFAVLVTGPLGMLRAPAALAAADPDRPFVFYGSGWGHGVGLSQYGAYGLALKGWSHERILEHYYTGTSVAAAPSPPSALRVGLAWDRSSIELRAVGGPVTLRLGKPDAKDKYKIPTGYAWTVRAASGHFELHNAKGDVVDTVGGPNWNLYASYVPGGGRVQLTGVTGTHTYNRGFLELNVYQPPTYSTWYVRAVAVLTPDEYLYGLGEVSTAWPMQALEAQVDAARSYAFNVVGSYGQRRTSRGLCNCGLYPTSDGYYIGYEKEIQGAAWLQAVDGTHGEVVLYNGHAISANYSSSSGGFTESNDNAWGSPPTPYLRAVCDPGDYTPSNPFRTWNVTMTASQIGGRLTSYGRGVGTVTGFADAVRTVSGRLKSVTVHGTSGSQSLSGATFAAILGLRDDKVWINVNRNVEGAFRTTYDNAMCKPGLATTQVMSSTGGTVQRFEDGAIYLPDGASTAYWSHGAVYEKYRSLHGPNSALGFPASGIAPVTVAGCGQAGSCSREDFRSGRIYFKGSAGAHELHGAVYDCYLKKGGAGGKLGFPLSDVTSPAAGASTASFEHGRITTDANGCKVKLS
jgi:SpoIID/LytB domain protein